LHKAFLNHLRLQVKLYAEEPLLVKEPYPADEQGRAAQKERKGEGEPDMLFVRIMRNGRLEPHIPGSSLKGPLRAYAERIVRTLIPGHACDPFDRIKSCSAKVAVIDPEAQRAGGEAPKEGNGAEGSRAATAYAASCPVCKVFGNAGLRARLSLSDAYLEEGLPIPQPAAAAHQGLTDVPWWWDRRAWGQEVDGPRYLGFRTRIPVDRFTGGVRETGPFNVECWQGKEPFVFQLSLRNFECWQLGLLAFLLRDVNDGYLKIGYGKNSGFGRVRLKPESLTVTYYGSAANDAKKERVRGIGALYEGADRDSYGFYEQDYIDLSLSEGGSEEEATLGVGYESSYKYLKNDIEQIMKGAAAKWAEYVESKRSSSG